jgi:hypothetical protein
MLLKFGMPSTFKSTYVKVHHKMHEKYYQLFRKVSELLLSADYGRIFFPSFLDVTRNIVSNTLQFPFTLHP